MRPSRATSPTERPHPLADALDLRSPTEIVRLLWRNERAAMAAVERALPQVARGAERIARALSDGGRLIYVGAGTSGRLGVLDASECPPTFGVSPGQVVGILAGGRRALDRAVEGAEDDQAEASRAIRAARVGPKDVVCGITASGKTPFVVRALEESRARGATTLLVCCTRAPAPVRVDVRISVETGPELIAGSTRLKAGTATKLVLNALSTAAMVRLGRVYRGRMVYLRPTNAKLRRRAERMVAELASVSLPRARSLLSLAHGTPALALALHHTGASPQAAARLLATLGLRRLRSSRKPKAP